MKNNIKIKKLSIVFIAFMVAVTLLMAYVSAFGYYDRFTNIVSIDSSNLMGQSEVYISGNSVFYNQDDGLYLYNYLDKSTKKVFEQPVKNIGGIQSTVFFESGNALYQTNSLANDIKKVHSGGKNYQIQGSYLYYIDVEQHKLCKVRNDNKLQFEIDLPSVDYVSDDFYYIVKNNNIIYNDEEGIKMCDADGSDEVAIYMGAVKNFCIEDKYIYILTDTGEILVEMIDDKQKNEKLATAEVYTVFNGNLFYSDDEGIKQVILAANLSGGEGSAENPIILSEDKATSMYNYEDVIYYYDENGDLYSLTTDKVKTKIN